MAHPGLALLLSGKLGSKPGDEDDDKSMRDEGREDAMKRLISVLRGSKPDGIHDRDVSEALQCFDDLLELCDDEPEDEDQEEDL